VVYLDAKIIYRYLDNKKLLDKGIRR